MALLKEFEGKFSKSITLRNELIPIGNTLNNIKKKQIIEADELRSENYKKAKLIIDQFHRRIIDQVLGTSSIDWHPLADLIQRPHDSDPEAQEKSHQLLEKQEATYRKLISDLFNSFTFESEGLQKKIDTEADAEDEKKEQLSFKDIFKEKLFSELLPPTLDTDEDRRIIEGFSRFTTYFKGFHDNRRNMYSDEAKATAIAYRIVNENFPKFLANLKVFRIWQEICPECIATTETELKKAGVLLETEKLESIFDTQAFNRFLGQAGIDLYNQIIGGLPAEPGQIKVTGLNEQVNLACQQNKDLTDKLKRKQSIKMNILFKQILSDKDRSFVMDEFKNDGETIGAVRDFYQTALNEGGCERILSTLIHKLAEFEGDGILIRGKEINALSKDLYGGENWSLIKEAISQAKEGDKTLIKHLKKDDSPESLDKFIAKQDYSIKYLSEITGKNIVEDIIAGFRKKEEALVNINTGAWPSSLKSAEEKENIKAVFNNSVDTALDLIYNIYIFERRYRCQIKLLFLDRCLKIFLPKSRRTF